MLTAEQVWLFKPGLCESLFYVCSTNGLFCMVYNKICLTLSDARFFLPIGQQKYENNLSTTAPTFLLLTVPCVFLLQQHFLLIILKSSLFLAILLYWHIAVSETVDFSYLDFIGVLLWHVTGFSPFSGILIITRNRPYVPWNEISVPLPRYLA